MKHAALLLGVALSTVSISPSFAQEDLTTINIIMPLQRSIGFYPLIVGEALGYFAEEGVQINLLSSDTTVPFVAFLQNGQADLATLDGPETFAAVAAGAEISMIYEAQQRVPEGIVVSEASEIQSVSELVGKTVGLVSDRDLNTLRWAMSSIGMDAEGIETVVVGEAGPTLARVLRDNSVAAVVGSITDWGPIGAAGIPVRIITPPEMAQAPSNNFVGMTANIEAKRDIIEGFLRAWAKGTAASEFDPEAMAVMTRLAVPEEWESPEFAQGFVDSARIVFDPVTELYGDVQPESWANLQAAMLDIGVVKAAVELEGHLDNSLIAGANDFDREEVKAEMAAWRAANM